MGIFKCRKKASFRVKNKYCKSSTLKLIPRHPPQFRDCLTTLGCGLSNTALFIVSGRHQAKLCGFAWFPSERQQKLAISADFLLWVLVWMREKREEVSFKNWSDEKNKSLRTSPAKTTEGWHRALGTETTVIFLSPMVSRDFVVSDSAVGKCLSGAPQTGGGLNGQEANWLLLDGSCPPTRRTSDLKSAAHMLAAKTSQHAPLSCETSKYAKRKPCGLLNGWNKNMGSLEVLRHWLRVWL